MLRFANAVADQSQRGPPMITEMMVAINGPIDTRPTWVGSKKYGGPPKTKLRAMLRT